MRAELDRRVIPEVLIDLVRSVQAHEPAHLAGGVALSGAHLSHRLSADIEEPLPKMLVPLTTDELRGYRDELRERFRRLAVP